MDSSNECIVMVDVSYYEKYAANAVWKRIKDDEGIEDDENFDPMSIPEFDNNFSWYFDCGLPEIVGKHYPLHRGSNYLFCMDSRRSDIWRKQLFSGYKHKRDFQKKRFEWSSIAAWVEHWVKVHHEVKHSRYIKINGSEADDIFAVMVKYVRENFPDLDIVIVSGDSDLLQLGNDHLVQIDAHGEIVTIQKRLEKDAVSFAPTPQNYLQYKIMIGDTSDNIPSIKHGKCGPKFAAKLIADKTAMVNFIKSDKQITENFMLNDSLINLQRTPVVLKESILNAWKEFDKDV